MASKKRKVVCISTTSPIHAITASGGGGSLVSVDPCTGSMQSSLRITADLSGKVAMGISRIHLFPSQYSESGTLALAYGSSAIKKDDTHAILLTLRPASLSPIVLWKCRLPETHFPAGLSISPCGTYVVGGGSSGTLYIWATIGGTLLNTTKAQYRAVSVLEWSSNNCIVSGGDDGMVHAWSLRDLVSPQSNSSTQPVASWSRHHLPITALASLPSGRMVSASQDGQVLILEIFSKEVVASFQLPGPVTSLSASMHRLFCGSENGTIYILDLDQYALHRTTQLGAKIANRKHNGALTNADRVFGSIASDGDEQELSYRVELRGHDRCVTALVLVVDNDEVELLVSGDQAGFVRVWDIASRACVRTIQPWSHTTASAALPATAKKTITHPVTSIRVVEERMDSSESGDIFGRQHSRNRDSSKNVNIVNLVKPLQKFVEQVAKVAIPFARPKRSAESMHLWNIAYESFDFKAALVKRRRRTGVTTKTHSATFVNQEAQIRTQAEEIERLRSAVCDKTETIQRWETVNNKLVLKLKQYEGNSANVNV
jgi:WD40 repeat protein